MRRASLNRYCNALMRRASLRSRPVTRDAKHVKNLFLSTTENTGGKKRCKNQSPIDDRMEAKNAAKR